MRCNEPVSSVCFFQYWKPISLNTVNNMFQFPIRCKVNAKCIVLNAKCLTCEMIIPCRLFAISNISVCASAQVSLSNESSLQSTLFPCKEGKYCRSTIHAFSSINHL